jgi:hypothetical protein
LIYEKVFLNGDILRGIVEAGNSRNSMPFGIFIIE